MTRPETAKLWAERMQRFVQAKTTVAQFCATEGVSQPSFYNWRRKLNSAASNSSPQESRFLPVQLQPPPGPTRTATDRVSTTIELPGGVRVCVEVPSETPTSRIDLASQ